MSAPEVRVEVRHAAALTALRANLRMLPHAKTCAPLRPCGAIGDRSLVSQDDSNEMTRVVYRRWVQARATKSSEVRSRAPFRLFKCIIHDERLRALPTQRWFFRTKAHGSTEVRVLLHTLDRVASKVSASLHTGAHTAN